MFTIAGGTAQILRTQVAGSILGMKLPQTRQGPWRGKPDVAARRSAAPQAVFFAGSVFACCHSAHAAGERRFSLRHARPMRRDARGARLRYHHALESWPARPAQR